MANQAPSRPWLRLASIRLPPSDPAPAPAPAPAPILAPAQPRPILSLPTFRSIAPPAAPSPPPAPAPAPTQAVVANGASQVGTTGRTASLPSSPAPKASPKPQVTNYAPSPVKPKTSSLPTTPVQTRNTFPSSIQTSPTQKATTPSYTTPSPIQKAAPTPSYTTTSPIQNAAPTPSYTTTSPIQKAAPIPSYTTPSPIQKAAPIPSPVPKPTVTYSQSPREKPLTTSPLPNAVTYSQSSPKQTTTSPQPASIVTYPQSPKQTTTSPQPKPAPVVTYSQSPKQMTQSSTSSAPKPALVAYPQSQTYDKTPPRSPITKPLGPPPPSPLSLPPSQAETNKTPPEAELQKTVLIQQQPNRPHANNWRADKHEHGNGKQAAHSPGDKKEKGKHYSNLSDHGMGMRIITITGENSGAVMEVTIGSPTKKLGHGNEFEDKNKVMMHRGSKSTFINSNVQGINDSIVFNSTVKDKDPGVHITLSTH